MYVYKLTNTANGMCYIGATFHPLERRVGDHFSRAKNIGNGRNSLLSQAIREFGEEVFTAEILRYARNSVELMMLEMQMIREHGTLTPGGYNMTTGGKGTMDRRQLESTKILISQKAKGRVISEETKAKLSAALKGKPQPWNKGRKLGPAWNKGIPHTPETRAKLVASHVGKRAHNARRIEMYGTVYESIREAAKLTGFSEMQVKYRLATGRATYIDGQIKTGRTPGNAKSVEYNGVVYKTVLEAARSNRMSATTMRSFISAGRARYINPPEKGITKEKDKQ